LDAIQKAIAKDRAARQEQNGIAEVRTRLSTLTPRECEVMARVTAGMLNKQIAAELGTSERTIKVHRGNVIRKMGATSLPDLVRMAEKLIAAGIRLKR
jgi:FixJ family two-component response regulator